MPRFFNPHFFDITLDVGFLTVRVFLNDNLCVKETETYSAPHRHKECELRYFAGGSSCYTVGSSKYMCYAGDYLLIPPDTFHAQLDDDNPHSINDSVQYNLRFSILDNSIIPPCSPQPSVSYFSVPHLVHTRRERIEPLLEVLTEEVYDKRPGYMIVVKSNLTALLVELLRPAETMSLHLFPEETSQYHNPMRMAIDQFFTYRYLEQLSTSDLAKELGFPVRQVREAIQEIYGMSFSKKLREMRVEAAKVLLRTTDRSVNDIATACGFETNSYFFASFKKLEGMTPCEYRENNRREEKSPA